jgi:hypothetical protein
MTDTILGLNHGGLPSDHPENAALGADRSAPLAADAVGNVNVRMLAPWAFREYFTLCRGLPKKSQ